MVVVIISRKHRASLSRPLGRVGEGLSLFFLNTEDTGFTEYHPAHFDNTEHRFAMDG